MFLSDVMTHTVLTIPSTATVRQAAQIMADEKVGFLPVIHEKEVCIGVLSDRDIVTHVVATGTDPAKTAVAQVMTTSGRGDEAETHLNARIASLPEDTPVEEAIQFMDEHNLHRVAVVDSEFHIVGVASRHDLEPSTKPGGVWQPY